MPWSEYAPLIVIFAGVAGVLFLVRGLFAPRPRVSRQETLQETADRLAASFDESSAPMAETMHALIEELDERMAALEELRRAASAEAARLEDLLAEAKRLPGINGDQQQGSGIVSYAQIAGRAELRAAATTNSAPLTTTSSHHAAERREQIYHLADSGHSAQAIADRLATPIGEVELILSLRPGR